MKIKEICEKLQITRKGLYWILEHNNFGKHAVKNEKTKRWTIDETGFEMIKDIRQKSKKVIVEVAPADPHVDATIRGMQIEIDHLKKQLETMTLKFRQGIYLRNSVEETVEDNKGLDSSIKREFLRLVAAFDKETTKTSIKRQLDEARKSGENILES